jgi:glucose/arabinose dehydrogenase
MLACASGSARPAATESALVDIGAGLQGPAGLTASVYVEGLRHVSALAADPDGRLWAATADYSDSGQDGVYLIAKTGAAPVKVIAGLHTPLGLLWNGGTLYVSSNGRIDAYSGFDGATFATHRTVAAFPSGTGQLNGLALTPDGRLVVGVSAPCDHCTPTAEWSASVVSLLPDGSDLRVVASGIRAPIGLVYYPGTSDLFVTMNQRDDLGDETPGDWLALVGEGDFWGFPNCYGQGGFACTGVPAPIAVLDKHAAVSGLAIVTGELGADTGSSAFVAEWATGKVLRVGLAKIGSTYTGSTSPFLTGLTNPVPLLLAPEGALLVGDWGTGTVYRIVP